MTKLATIDFGLMGTFPGEVGQQIIVKTHGFREQEFVSAIGSVFQTRQEARLLEGSWEWFGAAFRQSELAVVREFPAPRDHKGRLSTWLLFFSCHNWLGTRDERMYTFFYEQQLDPELVLAKLKTAQMVNLPILSPTYNTTADSMRNRDGGGRAALRVTCENSKAFWNCCVAALDGGWRIVELLRTEGKLRDSYVPNMEAISLEELEVKTGVMRGPNSGGGEPDVERAVPNKTPWPSGAQAKPAEGTSPFSQPSSVSSRQVGVADAIGENGSTVSLTSRKKFEVMWERDVEVFFSGVRGRFEKRGFRMKRKLKELEEERRERRRERDRILNKIDRLSPKHAEAIVVLTYPWVIYLFEVRVADLHQTKAVLEELCTERSVQDLWAKILMFGQALEQCGMTYKLEQDEVIDFQKWLVELVLVKSHEQPA